MHTAQLIPLPVTFILLQKIQIGFTFLVLAHPGSPGQRAIKRARVCVCGGSRKDGVSWRFSGLSQCLQCRVIVSFLYPLIHTRVTSVL